MRRTRSVLRAPKQKVNPDRNAWQSEKLPSDWQSNQKVKTPFTKPTSRQQAKRLQKGIERHVKMTVPIAMRKKALSKLRCGLSKEERRELAALNSYAYRLWSRHLNAGLSKLKTSKPVHAVTMISEALNADVNKSWPSFNAVREFVRHI